MYYLSFAWEFTLSSSLVGSLVCLITVLLFWPLVRRLLQINPSPVTSLPASLFHFLSPLSDAYTQAHTCIYNTPEQILFSNFLMVMWMKMPCFIQENILCTVMLTLFSSHIQFSFTFLKVMNTTFVHFQVPLTISPISPLLIPFTCLKFCLHQKTVCYLKNTHNLVDWFILHLWPQITNESLSIARYSYLVILMNLLLHFQI